MGQNILGVEMKIDQEYIKLAVEDIVKTAMVSALGDPQELVRKAIDVTVGTYVDSDGKPCKQDSYRAIPYMRWLAKEVVEKCVRESVSELLEANKELLKAEVLHQIRTKKFGEKMVGAFFGVVLQSAQSKYKMPISVNFEEPKEE